MTEADGAPSGGADDRSESEERIGIFPSWGWVYAAVLAWAILLIVVLWIFTVTLDYRSP